MSKLTIGNISSLWLIIFVFLSICISPTSLFAGDFDGSKPLLCAIIETVECVQGSECQRGTAESVGIPQFLKINFERKTITSTAETGPIRTTKIKNMERMRGMLILQGVQNGKAWSMMINEDTGKVVLSVSDVMSGFIVFGACTIQ